MVNGLSVGFSTDWQNDSIWGRWNMMHDDTKLRIGARNSVDVKVTVAHVALTTQWGRCSSCHSMCFIFHSGSELLLRPLTCKFLWHLHVNKWWVSAGSSVAHPQCAFIFLTIAMDMQPCFSAIFTYDHCPCPEFGNRTGYSMSWILLTGVSVLPCTTALERDP